MLTLEDHERDRYPCVCSSKRTGIEKNEGTGSCRFPHLFRNVEDRRTSLPCKTLFLDSHSTTILEKADDQEVGFDVTRLSSSRFKETLIPTEHYSRGRFNFFTASAPLWPLAAKAIAAFASSREFLITKCGAVVDGSTLNTKAIHTAIDQLGLQGGRHHGGPGGRLRLGRSFLQTKGGVLTCGSEATVVRDIIAEDCKITGAVRIATLKLRPHTPPAL